MTWKAGADGRLAAFLASEMEEPMMIGSYVLVAEAIDSTGDQCVMINSAPDQRMTATFGLLTYATEVERTALFRMENGE
jgi:hypothetical protein